MGKYFTKAPRLTRSVCPHTCRLVRRVENQHANGVVNQDLWLVILEQRNKCTFCLWLLPVPENAVLKTYGGNGRTFSYVM